MTNILADIGIVLLIFVILYVIFKIAKFALGIILNIIFGFIAIYLLNTIFNLGIRWDLLVIVITAIGGLLGVAVILLLKLVGITLMVI